MPLYQYKAIDAAGKFISGSLDAGNVNDLELRLEKMDMDLVTFKQKEHGADLFGRNKIGRRDLINFSFYLEQLTRAGVPLLEGLADLRDGEPFQERKMIRAFNVEYCEMREINDTDALAHLQVFSI